MRVKDLWIFRYKPFVPKTKESRMSNHSIVFCHHWSILIPVATHACPILPKSVSRQHCSCIYLIISIVLLTRILINHRDAAFLWSYTADVRYASDVKSRRTSYAHSWLVLSTSLFVKSHPFDAPALQKHDIISDICTFLRYQA